MTTEPKMPPLPESQINSIIKEAVKTAAIMRDGKTAQRIAGAVEAARDKQWAERVAELERVLGVARDAMQNASFACYHENSSGAYDMLNTGLAAIDAALSKEGG